MKQMTWVSEHNLLLAYFCFALCVNKSISEYFESSRLGQSISAECHDSGTKEVLAGPFKSQVTGWLLLRQLSIVSLTSNMEVRRGVPSLKVRTNVTP